MLAIGVKIGPSFFKWLVLGMPDGHTPMLMPANIISCLKNRQIIKSSSKSASDINLSSIIKISAQNHRYQLISHQIYQNIEKSIFQGVDPAERQKNLVFRPKSGVFGCFWGIFGSNRHKLGILALFIDFPIFDNLGSYCLILARISRFKAHHKVRQKKQDLGTNCSIMPHFSLD